jgi:hypothetical protein
VDLRSNGCRHARAPWTAPCTWCTGAQWAALSKRRGTRSRPYIADRTAENACKRGWRRTRRSAAARGGSSPALALDSVPGHQSDHELVQNDAGALAHVTGGLWEKLCLTGGRHRKGAERPLRRACGCAAVHEEKGNRAGDIAHSSRE